MEYVAITGSAGYIGSILAKHCHNLGYGVIGVDLKYRDQVNTSPYIDIEVPGCISGKYFSHICKQFSVSKVFHLAAHADVELSQKQPFIFYHNNVGNTAMLLNNLLEDGWAQRNGTIVYSSTAAVYKESPLPIAESAPKGSPNAYGRSKLQSEMLMQELYDFYKIPSVTFRYFNVAGANVDMGDHLDSFHVIPSLCRSVFNNQKFKLFGYDYDTSDGTCVRDFVDVNDICRAHFTAVEHLVKEPGVYKYNLGTYYGTTILELIRRFEDVINIDVNYDIVDRRSGDPGYLVADPSRFIEETGFEYSGNLESMLKSSWEFYCKKIEEKNGI